MKKYISSVIALVLTSVLMVGCSSSSNGTTETTDTGFNGKFVDGPVDGVTFACTGTDDQPLTGTTANGGVFGVCKTGSNVTFSLGNLELGSITQTEDNVFTPVALSGGDQAEANKIASVILSLSTFTTDPETGVKTFTVSPAAVTALNAEVDAGSTLGDVTQDEVDASLAIVIAAVPDANLTQTTAAEAETHLVEVEEQIEAGLIPAAVQPTTPPANTGSAS